MCASAKDRANLAKIVARAVAVASKPKARKRFKVHHQCGLLLPGLVVLTNSADVVLVAQAEFTEVRVVGLPNAGKSSLINALRGATVTARDDRNDVLLSVAGNSHKGKGGNAPVGGNPGTTRHVRGFTLKTAGSGGGDLIMIDTPGVMAPKIDDSLIGLRLAIAGGVGCCRIVC